mmetsp:Transcript_25131/g.51537  ORF Transcript_25131/g.51537 Transcript_25131/m.51537 type:complete len:224 (+) Transcript_25131:100-771(+)
MGEEYDTGAFVAVDEDGRGEDGAEPLLVEDMVDGKEAFGGGGGVVLSEGFGADSSGGAFEGAADVPVEVFEGGGEGGGGVVVCIEWFRLHVGSCAPPPPLHSDPLERKVIFPHQHPETDPGNVEHDGHQPRDLVNAGGCFYRCLPLPLLRLLLRRQLDCFFVLDSFCFYSFLHYWHFATTMNKTNKNKTTTKEEGGTAKWKSPTTWMRLRWPPTATTTGTRTR